MRAGARALLPTSSPFFSVRRRFVSTHSTRRTVGAGVCDQCVALAPVVMVTVRATHSETNDPPRSCVSACSRSPVRSRSRSTTVRGACLALPRVCVCVCVRARARVRIQVEVFRNALEALYGGSCELLRFANRMISFFSAVGSMQEACTTGEEMDERDRDIFFFGRWIDSFVDRLLFGLKFEGEERCWEADVLFGIGLLFLGLFRIDTRFSN